jgi:mannose-6-phosphate isomerase-like protein (cupin superfamily)
VACQSRLRRETNGRRDGSNVWLSTLPPDWSWERSIGLTVDFSSRPHHHREYVISGRIRHVTDDGTAVDAGPGDHLVIDPGHKAEVIGHEDCLLLDW